MSSWRAFCPTTYCNWSPLALRSCLRTFHTPTSECLSRGQRYVRCMYWGWWAALCGAARVRLTRTKLSCSSRVNDVNCTDFKKLAEIRMAEARTLLKARHYDGAYYLAGYAVECALKACIAKRTKKY